MYTYIDSMVVFVLSVMLNFTENKISIQNISMNLL